MPKRKGKGRFAFGAGILAMFAWLSSKKNGESDSSTGFTDSGDGYGSNYSYEDLTVTSKSTDNSPDTDEELANIQYTSRVMDEIVELIGYRPTINSAYRSDATNDAVGGVETSYHLSGLAVDIHIGKSSDADAEEKNRILNLLWDSDLPINEAIAYAMNTDGSNNPSGKSQIHLSFAKSGTGDREFLYTVYGSSGTFHEWTPTTFKYPLT